MKPHDCKQSESWTITEIGIVDHDHSYQHGEVSHAIEPKDYTNKLIFTCHECKQEQQFSRLYAPKWLKHKMRQVRITPDSEPEVRLG